MSGNGPDGELVRRAVDGDRVALKLVLTETYERLRGLVYQKLPPDLVSSIDPEDVVQDTHIEVFRRIGAFQSQGPDSFFRWIAAVALNRVRTLLRQYRTAKRGGNGRVRVSPWTVEDSSLELLSAVAAPGKTPSGSAARREAAVLVQAAVKRLPDRHNRAVDLVYLQGLTARETGERMGCTERAVHGLCRRGLKLLAAQLADPSSSTCPAG